nr:Plasmodium exported protein, unknown function [Plasmodium sp. DRC-Itaito]
MNIIYFNILFFSLLLDTFISSHTNIPRTNYNNSKNATINKTPKFKNKKDDNETKHEIEKLEREIFDARILCEDYIKNELKEISLLKDQIVKDKIEKDHWKKDKLIDYELNKLFLEEKRKNILESYEQYIKEQLEKKKLNDKILKQKLIKKKLKIEKFKNESIIYKIFLNIKNYFFQIINDVPAVELTCAQYFEDLFKKIFKKKKRKRKTFFELWSSFNDIMEEKVKKYQIGGYTIGIGIISGIAKSIHSIVATPAACAKAIAIKASCAAKAAQIAQTAQIVQATQITQACSLKTAANFTALNTACKASLASPDVATIVVGSIIIIILLIVLIIFIYFLIKKLGILENEHVQKVIKPIELFFDKYINKIKSFFIYT